MNERKDKVQLKMSSSKIYNKIISWAFGVSGIFKSLYFLYLELLKGSEIIVFGKVTRETSG